MTFSSSKPRHNIIQPFVRHVCTYMHLHVYDNKIWCGSTTYACMYFIRFKCFETSLLMIFHLMQNNWLIINVIPWFIISILGSQQFILCPWSGLPPHFPFPTAPSFLFRFCPWRGSLVCCFRRFNSLAARRGCWFWGVSSKLSPRFSCFVFFADLLRPPRHPPSAARSSSCPLRYAPMPLPRWFSN